MRVPGVVVGAHPLLVQSRKTNFAKRRSVGPQLIGDDKPLEQSSGHKEAYRRRRIGTALSRWAEQYFENLEIRSITSI
jgi:hypothetical protein